MDHQKMFNRVGPMLSPRGLRALQGASAGVQATLLSGVDVGVCLANVEGLAGFAEARGLTLDGMVEIGSVTLGNAPGDAAKTAWMNSNSSLGKLSKGATDKTLDQAAGNKIVQGELVYFAQQACQAAGQAANLANSSQDQGDIDAAGQAGTYCNLSRTNVDIGNAVVAKLPKTLGGGGGPLPDTKTCPAGQHLDASGNCVADVVPPVTETKSSTPWGLIAAGVAAALVIAVLATQPSEADKKKHKPKGALAAA